MEQNNQRVTCECGISDCKDDKIKWGFAVYECPLVTKRRQENE